MQTVSSIFWRLIKNQNRVRNLSSCPHFLEDWLTCTVTKYEIDWLITVLLNEWLEEFSAALFSFTVALNKTAQSCNGACFGFVVQACMLISSEKVFSLWAPFENFKNALVTWDGELFLPQAECLLKTIGI